MLTPNFTPFKDIETQRLYLRRLTIDDAPEVLALRGNPENMKYVPRPVLKNEEEAFLNSNEYTSLFFIESVHNEIK